MVFLVGINGAQKDAHVFEDTSAPKTWEENIKREKSEVDCDPGGEPFSIDI